MSEKITFAGINKGPAAGIERTRIGKGKTPDFLKVKKPEPPTIDKPVDNPVKAKAKPVQPTISEPVQTINQQPTISEPVQTINQQPAAADEHDADTNNSSTPSSGAFTEADRELMITKIRMYHANVGSVRKAIRKIPVDFSSYSDDEVIELYNRINAVRSKVTNEELIGMTVGYVFEATESVACAYTPLKLKGFAKRVTDNEVFNDALKSYLIEQSVISEALNLSPGQQCVAILAMTALSVHNDNARIEEEEQKQPAAVTKNSSPTIEPAPSNINVEPGFRDGRLDKPAKPVKPPPAAKKPAKSTLGGDFREANSSAFSDL
jgi:hypothetical protein